MSVGAAVIGSLQFGYNTGVINAPQKVSFASAQSLQESSSKCKNQTESGDGGGVGLG